jgi:hypothetical protein
MNYADMMDMNYTSAGRRPKKFQPKKKPSANGRQVDPMLYEANKRVPDNDQIGIKKSRGKK